MEIFLIIVLFLVASYHYDRLKKRVNFLEKELERFSDKLKELKQNSVSDIKIESPVREFEHKAVIVPQDVLPKEEEIIEVPKVSEIPPPLPPELSQQFSEPQKSSLSPKTSVWKKIEDQFAGNIIGVLGTVAIVLGVIFWGISAALEMPPEGRFFMSCLFCVGLYICHYLLAKKDIWKDLSLWLRSAAGAIFLVCCIGSIAEGPMHWIDEPFQALLILNLGLLTNLVMGFLNGGQLFTSVHILLSLMAIAVIPVSIVTFFMAAFITSAGILFSYRKEKWNENVIAISLGYFFLQMYWQKNGNLPVNDAIALLFYSIVGMSGIYLHYQRAFENKKLSSMALLTHLVSWGTFALNSVAIATNESYSSGLLLIAGGATFFLSNKAKSLNIPWLHIADKLVSLALFVFSALTLGHLGVSNFEIAVITVAGTIVFLRIVATETDLEMGETIFRVVNIVSLISYCVLFVQFFMWYGSRKIEISQIIFLGLISLLLIFVTPYIEKKADESEWGLACDVFGRKFFSSYLVFLLTIQNVIIYLSMAIYREQNLLIKSLLISSAVLHIGYSFYLKKTWKNPILDLGNVCGSILIILFGINSIFTNIGYSNITNNLILLIPLIFIGFFILFFNWFEDLKQKVVWPGVFSLWTLIIFSIYIFTKDIAPFMVTILMMIYVLLATEVKNLQIPAITGEGKHESFGKFVTVTAMLSIAIAGLRFFLYDIQSEVSLGFTKFRVFVEVFFILVTFYWWINSLKEEILQEMGLNYLLEFILCIGAAFIIYEGDANYLCLVWAILALGSLFLSRLFAPLARLRVYSFVIYVVSLIYVGFLTTTIDQVALSFLNFAWEIALVAIFIQLIYLVFSIKYDVFSFEKEGIESFSLATKLSGLLKKYDKKLLMYPMIVCVTLFLNWSFSNEILSLLLIAECFVVFLVSIYFGQKDFRMISMGGIALIVLRVLTYDLRGSDFLTKSFIFILIGAILVVMNAIYNRYKDRYVKND